MAFGTTNYPVFVEFICNQNGVKISVNISSIEVVSENIQHGGGICVCITTSNEEFFPEGTYSEVMQKINAKIPKPAKWPPTEGSKKDDHLPTRKENIQPQPVTTTGQSGPR